MKEQLVSFQVAKLAKEKGFDLYQNYFYTEEDGLCSIGSDGEILNIYDENLNQIDYRYDCNGDFWFNDEGDVFYTPEKYLAPTQSLLAKWLREEHKMHIVIMPCIIPSNEVKYYIFKGKLKWDWAELFDTYEEALEFGLLETLKLI